MSIWGAKDGSFKAATGLWAAKGGAWVQVPLGSAPFVPTDLTGLGLWLEADKILGLADNASVVAWPDASGNGRDAVPVTTAPKWRSSIDGQPAVEFTGGATSTRLRIQGFGTALQGKSAYTLFMVLRQTTSLASYPIILTAPTAAMWQFLFEFDNTGKFFWGHTNGKYRFFDTFYVIGAKRLYSLSHAANPQFFQNSIQITSYSLGTSGDMTTVVPTLGTDVLLGGYFDGTAGINGYVWALLWYDRTLSVVERGQVESYLAGKYGPFT